MWKRNPKSMCGRKEAICTGVTNNKIVITNTLAGNIRLICDVIIRVRGMSIHFTNMCTNAVVREYCSEAWSLDVAIRIYCNNEEGTSIGTDGISGNHVV